MFAPTSPSRRLVGGRCALAAAACLGSLSPHRAVAQDETTLSVVALQGQAAPGLGAGVTFASLEAPAINNAGQVLFAGTVTGAGVTAANNSALWRWSPSGTAVLVAREGDAAPGTLGAAVFSGGFTGALIDNSGRTVFRALLSGALVNASNNVGVWMGTPGSLALMARTGVGGTGLGLTVNFTSLQQPRSFAGGRFPLVTAFSGGPVSAANDTAIFVATSMGLTLRAREGSIVPGTAVNYGDLSGLFPSPLINSTGEILFITPLVGAGVTFANNQAVIAGGTPLTMAARTGSAAPDIGGATFDGFFDPDLNNSGRIAFRARVSGGGVTGANSLGIWFGLPSMPMLTLRTADTAPGAGAGAAFTDFRYGPFLAGPDAAFSGFYSGPSAASAIWLDGAGGTQRSITSGVTAPGTGGQVFNAFDDDLSTFGVNSNGQVILRALTTAFNDGLWATDRCGRVIKLGFPGDAVTVGPADVRTVTFLANNTLFGAQGGAGRSLNDDGFAAFRASFTDTTSAILLARLGNPACPCDWNRDGVLDSQDYFDFLTSFFATRAFADFNCSGATDSQDYFDFFDCLITGCN